MMHLISCSLRAKFEPDLSLISPYSYELEASEPFTDQPFISIFRKDGRQLTYVAAHHDNNVNSPTYRLINEAMYHQKPKMVILEGFETSLGLSPRDLLQNFKETSTEAFFEWGEPAYAAIQADKVGILFVGGEPDDIYVLEEIKKVGYTTNDLLGFYFVRQIPQFRRGKSLESKSAQKIFEEYLRSARHSLQLPSDHRFSYLEFVKWYKENNKKKFTLKSFHDFDGEEVAPLEHGKFATQKISHAVGMVRDKYVVSLVAELVNKYNNVMIVFGRSHLPVQRKALEAMFGAPVLETVSMKDGASG